MAGVRTISNDDMSGSEAGGAVNHNGVSPQGSQLTQLSSGNPLLEEMPSTSTCTVKEPYEDPPVIQIERDLDELTYSGAAINDLEVQLTRTKQVYHQVLVEGKTRVDVLRKKLHSHIIKSEPFVEIWRRARQVQEMSNKAAARYDKANSQHLAAKEMIRVAESQLADCKAERNDSEEEPSSQSPLDLAWQEMLNHATSKVVVTEKERRDSELDHKRILEECKTVMDNYRLIERKLRPHIIKSRPYFQERYRVNQNLEKLKSKMKGLERKINDSKQSYTASLRRLEALNTEIHERRLSLSIEKLTLDPRQVSSTGSSPDMRRLSRREPDMLEEVISLEIGLDFHGSTGSLPSVGMMSDSPSCDSDLEGLEADREPSTLHKCRSSPNDRGVATKLEVEVPSACSHPLFLSKAPSHDTTPSQTSCNSNESDALEHLASEITVRCLTRAISKLTQEGRSSNS